MLSTSLAVDLYKTFFDPGVSQQRLLTVSRIAIGCGRDCGYSAGGFFLSIISQYRSFMD